MENIILKLYENKNYDGYGSAEQFFATYVPDAGLYLTTEKNGLKVLEKPTFEIDNDNNMDSYVTSRGFKKILDYNKDDEITWFNGYDSLENKTYIRKNLFKIRNNICFSFLRNDENCRRPLSKVFAALLSLENAIKL